MSEFAQVGLWKYAEVNPLTPEFNDLPDGEKLSFFPLEHIWSGGAANYSESKEWKKSETSYTKFRRGDILVPKVTPTVFHGRSMIAEISTDVGLASSEVHVMRARENADPRWLTYNVLSSLFLDRARGDVFGVGGLKRISDGYLARYPVTPTPLDEQHRIANYLDEETAEIDATMVELDRYVELMEKRREVLINRLIEGAPIPLHLMSRIVDCVHTTPARAENGVGEAVRTSSIRGGRYIPGQGIPISEEALTGRNRELTPTFGDIFFTREAPAGEACLVPEVGKFSSGQRVVTLRPTTGTILPSYLLYALYSNSVRQRWLTTSTGSTVTNIKLDTIGQTRIPVPSIDRQQEIVDYLDHETAEIDAIIDESTRLRELLLKRRPILITEVVTGRKRV